MSSLHLLRVLGLELSIGLTSDCVRKSPSKRYSDRTCPKALDFHFSADWE